MNPQPNPSRNRSAAASVQAVLWLLITLLLLALGSTAFLLYRAKSGQLSAEKALNDANARLTDQEAKAKEADAKRKEQERNNRLAVAQTLRDSFASRAGVVTNGLHGLLDRIPEVERELNDFRNGAKGIPITRYPALVEECANILDTGLSLPPRPVAVSHLEGIRAILIANAAAQGTEAQPSPEAEKVLDDARAILTGASSDLAKVTSFMAVMLSRTKAKLESEGGKPAASLEEAITLHRAAVTLEREQRLARAMQLAQQTKDLATNRAIIAGGERAAEAIKAEMERMDREMKAALAKQKLIEEAKSAQVQDLLAPVIAPGRVDCCTLTELLPERGPMSWSKLSALIDKDKGVEQLHRLTSSTFDKDRPRLPRVNLNRDSNTYDRVVRMRATLQRLGPTLVELGMLRQ